MTILTNYDLKGLWKEMVLFVPSSTLIGLGFGLWSSWKEGWADQNVVIALTFTGFVVGVAIGPLFWVRWWTPYKKGFWVFMKYLGLAILWAVVSSGMLVFFLIDYLPF